MEILSKTSAGSNGKIHIVAAPGSGKTTLGIELIRRIGEPCLILCPSIAIRQQWISRMKEGFLSGDWFSDDLSNICPITVITYQALHSAVKQGFSETASKAGIHTVCLDEAHHLRGEWWKALENFLKDMPDMSIISLTATPPYDSTSAEWKCYIDLCGPIDEEIFTPELVKEGSLCPHQDYVYFNWPKDDEIQMVRDYTQKVENVVASLL